MIRRTPTQQRSREVYAQIVDAAGSLIARDGLEKLTTKSIAADAEISQATVYQYFANIDEIIAVYIEQELTKLGDGVRVAMDGLEIVSIRTLFAAIVEANLAYFRGNPQSIALWLGGRLNPVVFETVVNGTRELAQMIDSACRQAGLLRSSTPEWSTELLIRAFDRTFEYAFAGDRSVEEQAQIIDTFLEMTSEFAETRYATKKGIEGISHERFVALTQG